MVSSPRDSKIKVDYNIEYNKNDKDNKAYILFGRNVGESLEDDIKNAKQSVIVVSPFIAATKMDTLVNLSNNGINVKLYLAEDKNIREDIKLQSILKKAIKQEEVEDYVKVNKKKGFLLTKNKKFLSELKKQEKETIYIRKLTYKYKYVNKDIEIFYINKNDDESRLHAKYYIIDEKIVYTGSLNLTNNGIAGNLETCIKLEDEVLAKKIANYTKDLFSKGCGFYYHNCLDSTSIHKESLGHIIYNINK